MKKALAVILTLSLLVLAGCGSGKKTDLSGAKSLADLAGTKIAAQSGTFHEDAMAQIKDAKTSTYPDFTDLLVALKSGAIDGYVAEEPTALSVCKGDEALAYVPLVNNDTGFTATAADVGIAIGLKKGSPLKAQIDAALATVTEADKKALMEQMVSLTCGETVDAFVLAELNTTEGTETNGVLKVAMECAYEPYNWTETGAKTPGAVKISGEGKDGLYANGYDVQIARYVAKKLNMKLEIYAIEWDSLLPAVQSGTVDAIVAGMSPTAERAKEVDFTVTYYESNLVVIYKK